MFRSRFIEDIWNYVINLLKDYLNKWIERGPVKIRNQGRLTDPEKRYTS